MYVVLDFCACYSRQTRFERFINNLHSAIELSHDISNRAANPFAQ
jgi:hypothetical protein